MRDLLPLLVIAIRRWPVDRQHLATRLPLHLGLTLAACVGKIALCHPIHQSPLRDEMELFDRALSIVLVRFSDRVRVAHDVERDILDAPVPSFILQPLVENAFEPGVASSPAAA